MPYTIYRRVTVTYLLVKGLGKIDYAALRKYNGSPGRFGLNQGVSIIAGST